MNHILQIEQDKLAGTDIIISIGSTNGIVFVPSVLLSEKGMLHGPL